MRSQSPRIGSPLPRRPKHTNRAQKSTRYARTICCRPASVRLCVSVDPAMVASHLRISLATSSGLCALATSKRIRLFSRHCRCRVRSAIQPDRRLRAPQGHFYSRYSWRPRFIHFECGRETSFVGRVMLNRIEPAMQLRSTECGCRQ